jgi:anti-sigma-K factor RskA
MRARSGRPRSVVLALVALLAVAIVAGVALSAGYNLSGKKTYATATVSGKIVGQVFTEGNAVGVVTAMSFQSTSSQSKVNQFDANVKTDGTYSITLTNGMNYTVVISVVDPNNNADTGVCQAQPVSLNNTSVASYAIDITPFNCG